MPTYLALVRFRRDWDRLTPQQQGLFRAALALFVEDLRKAEGFRRSLRVEKMAGHDVWEMTWAPDGRATFTYGESVKPGEVHIVWHRVGAHAIFKDPV
ncbi:hypothetical protein [Actinocrinis sp.]|uniref:hypothetical protein n=1 Tax=Actinocrinis sp. TaxID=1920516 RepID=UPI002C0D8156|nr:hypothetical protein [Actinocrinis sp.]HXR71103.1 hypothetical protein [Actinocrinis sp.]